MSEERPTVALISGEDVARMFEPAQGLVAQAEPVEPAGGLSGPVTVTSAIEEKDPNKIYLKEETSHDIIAGWMEKAKKVQTPEDAAKLIHELNELYGHDYGTIVHACVAGARAGFSAVNNGPQGGITGFQAGFVMWGMVREFGLFETDGPLSIVEWEGMLYPHRAEKFDKVMSKETWEWIQKRAGELLNKHLAEEADAVNTGRDFFPRSPETVEHWKSIVAGTMPFGYKLKEE